MDICNGKSVIQSLYVNLYFFYLGVAGSNRTNLAPLQIITPDLLSKLAHANNP